VEKSSEKFLATSAISLNIAQKKTIIQEAKIRPIWSHCLELSSLPLAELEL
jgi:hypothetical protein